MSKVELYEPIHHCEITLQMKDSGVSGGWRDIELPDNFLSLNNSNVTIDAGPVGVVGQTAEIRFLVYFDEPTPIDKIVLEGLSEKQGLIVSVFADDVTAPQIPSNQIGVVNQGAQSLRRNKATEIVDIADTVKQAYVFSITGFPLKPTDYTSNVVTVNSSFDEMPINIQSIEDEEWFLVELSYQATLLNGASSVTESFGVGFSVVDLSKSAQIKVFEDGEAGDFGQTTATILRKFKMTSAINNPDELLDPILRFDTKISNSANVDVVITGVSIVGLTQNAPISIDGLFLGKKPFDFDEGHDWGNASSDFNDVIEQKGAGQLYTQEEFAPRSTELIFVGESDAVYGQLRDFIHRVYSGYCFCDINPSSDDIYSKFLGSIQVMNHKPINVDKHSFDIKLVERKK